MTRPFFAAAAQEESPLVMVPRPGATLPRLRKKTGAVRTADLDEVVAANGYLLDSNKRGVTFIPTGCTLLDCVLGGGWAQKRVINVVGDFSTGKSLLAIEACANFRRLYPQGKIFYRDAEAAFDVEYSTSLGLPPDLIDFSPDFDTVEGFFRYLDTVLIPLGKRHKSRVPILFVQDSLDALGDEAENERDIGKGSFDMAKQKKLSQLFRRATEQLAHANITMIVVSQIRHKIGVMFGEQFSRGGGKALDFYASQVVWLSEAQKIVRTMHDQTRVIGIRVKARCKKNKVGLPFRECEFPILFGYGVDSVAASVYWLRQAAPALLGDMCKVTVQDEKKAMGQILAWRQKQSAPTMRTLELTLDPQVKTTWATVEAMFLPSYKKYGDGGISLVSTTGSKKARRERLHGNGKTP